MTKYILLAPFLIFACNSFTDPIIESENFNSAYKQAEADKDRDGPGCYMECRFDPYFGGEFQSIMRACFKTLDKPEVKTFETVLAVDENGEIAKVWLNLKTNLSLCALDSIAQLKFPSPPFSPYHARITMNLE